MDILACPMCKSELILDVGTEENGEIVSGRLTCSGCRATYPIEDRIPNLLPPELRRATT